MVNNKETSLFCKLYILGHMEKKLTVILGREEIFLSHFETIFINNWYISYNFKLKLFNF